MDIGAGVVLDVAFWFELWWSIFDSILSQCCGWREVVGKVNTWTARHNKFTQS